MTADGLPSVERIQSARDAAKAFRAAAVGLERLLGCAAELAHRLSDPEAAVLAQALESTLSSRPSLSQMAAGLELLLYPDTAPAAEPAATPDRPVLVWSAPHEPDDP